jgi:hypothetical protein
MHVVEAKTVGLKISHRFRNLRRGYVIDERSARRAAFAAGKELLTTWTSQGLGHLAERAEVPIGAWSVIAHCSAFAAGKELRAAWTSPRLGHLAERAEAPIGAWSVIAHCSAFVGILG